MNQDRKTGVINGPQNGPEIWRRKLGKGEWEGGSIAYSFDKVEKSQETLTERDFHAEAIYTTDRYLNQVGESNKEATLVEGQMI